MKRAALLFLILTSALAVVSHAAELSPQARLRKLSLHIRGMTPEDTDYTALDTAVQAHTETAFFQGKTRDYLASPQHTAKMMTRLDELFRVNIMGIPPENFSQFDAGTVPTNYESGADNFDAQDIRYFRNSMDRLFRSVVQENSSWDQLLTDREYHLYFLHPPAGADPYVSSSYESGFLDEFLDSNQTVTDKKNDDFIIHTMPPEDLGTAGAITTARFADRYQTSDVNMNRRRAAAVFRIFLCDEMRPVAVSSNTDRSEFLDTAFLRNSSLPKGTLETPTEMLHGADKQCLSCHYKLDPLGEAFNSMSSVLYREPSPGALVYDRPGKPRLEIKGRGLSEVALAITQQPEYARCQVRHFWEWFIGKDLPLSDARLDALTDRFNSLGRKVNDFIGFLVNEPEFSGHGTALNSRATGFLKAKPFLAACNSCHTSQDAKSSGDAPPPSFTELPIGGSSETHARWIIKVANAIDLEHHGAHAKMPPSEANWDSAQIEKANQAIREWIQDGAPDSSGNSTWTGAAP